MKLTRSRNLYYLVAELAVTAAVLAVSLPRLIRTRSFLAITISTKQTTAKCKKKKKKGFKRDPKEAVLYR